MLKTIKTKQHHIIMREVLIKICHEKQNERRMICQTIQNICKLRNNFLYFSWEKLTSNWGKKLLIFGRGNHLILAVFRPLKN